MCARAHALLGECLFCRYIFFVSELWRSVKATVTGGGGGQAGSPKQHTTVLTKHLL